MQLEDKGLCRFEGGEVHLHCSGEVVRGGIQVSVDNVAVDLERCFVPRAQGRGKQERYHCNGDQKRQSAKSCLHSISVPHSSFRALSVSRSGPAPHPGVNSSLIPL